MTKQPKLPRGKSRGKIRRCGDYGHKTSAGKPCRAPAITGGTVCLRHGGRAPQVKAAAAKRIQQVIESLVDPNAIIRELARIAYADLRNVLDERGRLLPASEWSEDAARAIAGLEITQRNLTAGDGKVEDVVKVKSWDKLKAIELLMKHAGMLTERTEHSGGIVLSWADEA